MYVPLPDNERARLEALRQLDILDTAPDQAFDDLVRLAAVICGTPIAAINLVDAERQWCKAIFGLDADALGVRETPRETAFCAYTILEQSLTIIPDVRDDARFFANPAVSGEAGIRFYAGAPLLSDDGYALGALCVVDYQPRTLTPDQKDALRLLARQVANQIRARRRLAERERLLDDKERLIQEKEQMGAALDSQKRELEKISAELEALETTDGLTGLYDRRAFQERLDEEVGRTARYGTPLSLIMLDIDDFKGYNDSFGHPAGDAALIAMARILERDIREQDVVARYGGEEFVLILPQTDSAGAAAYAERVRATIEEQQWAHRALTASFGTATLHLNEDSAALIARADAALYGAKAAGRNCVVAASNVADTAVTELAAAAATTL